MKVLVTGASGFIGKALLEKMRSNGVYIKAIVRKDSDINSAHERLICSDFNELYKHKKFFSNVDCVIHLAGLAHNLAQDESDSLQEFRMVNRDFTLMLSKISSDMKVGRFIFMSSIGVNGNNNTRPFTELDQVCPVDQYAISKHEAEIGLLSFAKNIQMEVVIIRPPLVYGPNAPGNFNTLLSWLSKGVPLPFGRVKNKRSFIALENLLHFIILCSNRNNSPLAANQIFLISDGEDVSITQFLRKVSKSIASKTILFPVPVFLLKIILNMFGKSKVSNRLFGSLQVDSSKAESLLGWRPIVTMDEQLNKIAEEFSIEKTV